MALGNMLGGFSSSIFLKYQELPFQVGYFSLEGFQSPEINLRPNHSHHSSPNHCVMTAFFFLRYASTYVLMKIGVYIWNHGFFFLIFQLLFLHSYNKALILFFLSYCLSVSLACSSFLFLTLLTAPEACRGCRPINGLQATEDTKHTTAEQMDLLSREPGGISVRAFFISFYQP